MSTVIFAVLAILVTGFLLVALTLGATAVYTVARLVLGGVRTQAAPLPTRRAA